MVLTKMLEYRDTLKSLVLLILCRLRPKPPPYRPSEGNRINSIFPAVLCDVFILLEVRSVLTEKSSDVT